MASAESKIAIPREDDNQLRLNCSENNHISSGHQNQASNSQHPCMEVARKFLTLLDEDAEEFTFQTFDDDNVRKNPCLARIYHGSLDQFDDEFMKLQQDGAGIFVTINETDLKGRSAQHILRVRALFVDLDGAPLDPLYKAPIEPHMISESSPGKYHVYWFIEGCPLDRFSDVQKQLAAEYGGDQKVKDLPRVMRLPGFYHQKAVPFQTRILEESGALPISFEEFQSAFKIEVKEDCDERVDPIPDLLQKRGMIKQKDNRQGCFSCPKRDFV